MSRVLSGAVIGLSCLFGVAIFAFPFVTAGSDLGATTPLLITALLMLCLGALFIELQGAVVSAKMVAVLGVLIALTAVLRFIETALPGPGGFSPIFAPIIMAGFIFGSRFGFLMGALTLLVSALITGGVGPWLPYQMFAAGWIGLGAGWLPHRTLSQRSVVMLAVYGFVAGMVYGLIMTVYTWSFIAVDGGALSADSPLTAVKTYIAFYLASASVVWDLFRAGGNVLLISVLGLPALRALNRLQHRFSFEWGQR